MYSHLMDIYNDPIEEYCERLLYAFSLYSFSKTGIGGQDDVSRRKVRSLRSFPSDELKLPGITVNTRRKITAKNTNQRQKD